MSILTDRSAPSIRLATVLATSFLTAACINEGETAVVTSKPQHQIGGKDELTPGGASDDIEASLTGLAQPGGPANDGRKIRSHYQREAALRFGSQSGFVSRARDILKTIESRSGELSSVYDFSRVTRPAPGGTGLFVPPVVRRAEDAFQSASNGRTISASDTYHVILKPERLSPVQPTWQDWLLFEPGAPKPLPTSMSPVDAAERRQVKDWINEGWTAGARQADRELSDRLHRLQRDFEGMLEFRRLAALGMIDEAEFASAEFGITGEPGEMRIGDRTISLEGEVDFRRDPTRWRRPAQPASKPNKAPARQDDQAKRDRACREEYLDKPCRPFAK